MTNTFRLKDHLTDGIISLRRYRSGDAPALFNAINDSYTELIRWGFYHPDYTCEDAEKEVNSRISDWDEGKAFTYLIEEQPGSMLIGNCNISEFEPEKNHAALGWWVRTSMTNKGIATTAGRLVANAAFEDLQLSALSIYARAENIASRRVAEKLGAILVRIRTEPDGRECAVYELRPEFLTYAKQET